MRRLLLFLALSACSKPGDSGSSAEAVTLLDELVVEGPAPWDGVGAVVSTCIEDDCDDAWSTAAPLVLDASGEAVALQMREVPYQAEPTFEGDLPAGSYVVSGVGGEDLGWTGTFTVEPFGRDAAFDPTRVAGGLWQVDDESFSGGPVPHGWRYLYPNNALYLRLGTPADGRVPFTVIMLDTSQQSRSYCAVLQDTADLSATGELTWSSDARTLASEPEIRAWALSLRLGFSADGDEIAGGQARLVVDTSPITATWGDVDACGILGDNGADPCFTCPEGTGECASLAVYGTRMYRTTDDVPEVVDPCSLVWADVDTACGCAQVPGGRSPWFLLAALGILGLRRRGKEGRLRR